MSKYAAQFDALRDSIEGDPTPDEIAELAATIALAMALALALALALATHQTKSR